MAVVFICIITFGIFVMGYTIGRDTERRIRDIECSKCDGYYHR